MPAAKEFLVYAFVTRAAITGGQMGADCEAVVIHLLLAGTRLVAVEAIDALLCVSGHFVFMDDRVLKSSVTFGALSRCADKVGRRLIRFHIRALQIDKERRHNECKRDDYSEKHGTKRHKVDLPGKCANLNCPGGFPPHAGWAVPTLSG
jgi:hypothetical protein